ncbi:MAG: phosphoribosyltransferase domain-containing protein [Anaerobutyricum soehngenii]
MSEDKKTLVIGFAETATGLGMSLATSIRNCTYVTTTREHILDKNTVFTFEEEHSHATTNKLYFSDFDKFNQVFLVDDEITTGKSMLNIITAIKNVSNINDFSIFSLLDWRNKENKKQYEELQEKLNISIHNYSLIAGTICEETKETLPKDKFSSLLKDDTFLFIPCTLRDYSQIMRILFI